MEKPFDSRELLADTFDFTRCQRPDGSFYGTSGQCRKGVESNLDPDEAVEKGKAVQKDLDSARSASISAMMGSTLDRAIVAEEYAAAADIDVKSDDLMKAQEVYDAKVGRIMDDMANNKVSVQEMEDFLLNRQFFGDPETADTLVIGIETKLSNESKNMLPEETAGRAYDRQIAQEMALHQMRAEGMNRTAVDVIQGTSGAWQAGTYNKDQAAIVSAVQRRPVSADDTTWGNGRVFGTELRTMMASDEGSWEVGSRSWAQQPGMKERIGDRLTYQKRYGSDMAKNMMRDVNKAVENNPTQIIIGMGKSKEANQVRETLFAGLQQKYPDAKVGQWQYKTAQTLGGKEYAQTGTIMVIPRKGKPDITITDFGASISPSNRYTNVMNGVRTGGDAKQRAFATMAQKAKLQLEKGELKPRMAAQATARRARSATAKATPTPKAPPKPKPTQSQINEQKAAIKGLLDKAKANRDTGAIRQYQTMLNKLG